MGKTNAIFRYRQILLVLPFCSFLVMAEECFKPASPGELVAAANELCTLKDTDGHSEYYDVNGNVSLGAITKKLFGVSAGLKGKIGKSEYSNVLQKDLITAMKQRGKCDDVLKLLVDLQKVALESSKNCSQISANEKSQRQQQKAALRQEMTEIYSTFTQSFRDQATLLFGKGSLVDAIQSLSAKESILTDIELAFSPEAYNKASRFFEIARQCIACAWNEENKPANCKLQRKANGEHPSDRYDNVYASLKKRMSADIRSNDR